MESEMEGTPPDSWMVYFTENPIWSYFSLVNDDNLLRTMNYLHFIVVSTCLQHQT